MSYHDLLTMYGGEQLEAEQRVYIYVQQPKRYKTTEDIARKDADIARQIERMERLIDDLRDYRVALAQRYAELETMPYTRVLTLKRDPSYKGRITYWVTITRRMSDGTETDELREQIADDIAPCTEQAFFTAYEAAHAAKYGEEWELSKSNPCY